MKLDPLPAAPTSVSQTVVEELKRHETLPSPFPDLLRYTSLQLEKFVITHLQAM